MVSRGRWGVVGISSSDAERLKGRPRTHWYGTDRNDPSGREFDAVEGRIVVGDDGRIEAIEEESVESSNIIVPAFVNAHTHIGDSIAKEAGRGLTLEELVAPPDGLKHRLLREADRAELVDAMRTSLRFMQRSGTAAHMDFREGDVPGVEMLREAGEGLEIDALAFARGSIEAMEAGDGFGASGANDATFDREREATRGAEKPFGIHAGEVDATDIDPALDLEPEFLVHVVHPESDHLERIADQQVPVVVCPRSNLVTDVGLSPYSELAERTTLALGTDNVMLNSPSMFREMAVLSKISELSAPKSSGWPRSTVPRSPASSTVCSRRGTRRACSSSTATPPISLASGIRFGPSFVGRASTTWRTSSFAVGVTTTIAV